MAVFTAFESDVATVTSCDVLHPSLPESFFATCRADILLPGFSIQPSTRRTRREYFRRYSLAAIQCPGPETETLASWAKELSLHIVIGVVDAASLAGIK